MLKERKCCGLKYQFDWDGSKESLKLVREFDRTVFPGFAGRIPDGFSLLVKPVLMRSDDSIDTNNSVLSFGLFDNEFKDDNSIYHRKMFMLGIGGLFGNNVVSVDVFNGSEDKRRAWSLRELISVSSALRGLVSRVRGCNLMWWGSKRIVTELLNVGSVRNGFEIPLFIDNLYNVVRRSDVYQFKYSLLKYNRVIHIRSAGSLFDGGKLFEFRKSYYGRNVVNVISSSNVEIKKLLGG